MTPLMSEGLITTPPPYPAETTARDQWIVNLRPARAALDPLRPSGYFLEDEPDDRGALASTATIFLANRECPWRCVMCDLWKAALERSVPPGAIPTQIDYALERLGFSEDAAGPPSARPTRQLKLYNAGSFFDRQAIPPEDYPAIAQRVSRFDRVIVECHPALVGEPALRFRDLLLQVAPRRAIRTEMPVLEVAMGLETAHPEVLARLNKRMTLPQFARAADFLKSHGVALRVFVLVQPPFMAPAEVLHWTQRSVQFAFELGATVVTLIPTRGGNGAVDALQRQGAFNPPKLALLETAHEEGLRLRAGRVFADLWDLERFSECAHCFQARRERLRQMNLEQRVLGAIQCAACGCGGLLRQPRESKPWEPAS